MKKYPVIWMPRARRDLRGIKQTIAEHAPSTAKSFVRRIRERVRKIGVMPTAAPLVIEAARPDLREIYVASYRIIYRVREEDVHVLMIIHGAQLFSADRLQELDE